jgi:hypothetical protein
MRVFVPYGTGRSVAQHVNIDAVATSGIRLPRLCTWSPRLPPVACVILLNFVPTAFDTANQTLYFSSDGSQGSAIAVTSVQNGVVLTPHDLLIV